MRVHKCLITYEMDLGFNVYTYCETQRIIVKRYEQINLLSYNFKHGWSLGVAMCVEIVSRLSSMQGQGA